MSYNTQATIDIINREVIEILVQTNKFFKQYDSANSIPTISLQETAVLGVAAVLVKNPVVSRRFWSG